MKRAQRKVLRWVLAVLAVLCAGALWFATQDHTIDIQQQDLQEALDELFPVSDTYLKIFTLTLAQPKIQIHPDTDRIYFSLRALTNVPLDEGDLTGDATVSAKLRYDRSEGAFYLVDMRVDKLDLSHREGEYGATVRIVLSVLMGNVFEENPVYQLDGSDRLQAFVKGAIREVKISRGRVLVTMRLL